MKDSKNFADFKTEAAKLLTTLNERHLRTEFDTAKATSVGTANALRAIADGAKFMRYKATQDSRTRPYHASLHNQVFDMSQPGWQRLLPPLGWGCRCHVVYEDAANGPVTSYEEAEQKLGPDEVARLTKDGFLLDRVDKKALFSQKQSYLNGLQDPEQIAFKIGKMQASDQGQLPWAQIDKSGFDALDTSTGKTAADARADFVARATNDAASYTDYTGRPLFLPKTNLEEHLLDKYTRASQNRQGIYFQLDDIVSDPDEVYFFDYYKQNQPTPVSSYTYLKFYNDDVLLTVVEFDKELPQTIKTWYKVDKDKIDSRRKGLLIHKK